MDKKIALIQFLMLMEIRLSKHVIALLMAKTTGQELTNAQSALNTTKQLYNSVKDGSVNIASLEDLFITLLT